MDVCSIIQRQHEDSIIIKKEDDMQKDYNRVRQRKVKVVSVKQCRMRYGCGEEEEKTTLYSQERKSE